MATQENDIKKLLSEQKELEKKLLASKTAYAGNIQPTKTDLSENARLEKIKGNISRIKSDEINKKWYGEDSEGENRAGQKRSGIIDTTLNALSTPLYGIVGAVESALGKGTKAGVLDNITSNVKEREGFGSLLQKYKAPLPIAAPIGFMLDVAFDPVNWATAGTTALIPKIGYGLAKGATKGVALEAMATGAKAGVLEKAAAVGKYIPKLNKTAQLAKVGEEAVKAGEKYNSLLGRSVGDILKKNAERVTIGDWAEQAILRLPNGENLIKQFGYDPQRWNDAAELVDKIENEMRKRGTILEPRMGPDGTLVGPSAKEIQIELQKLKPGKSNLGVFEEYEAGVEKIGDVVKDPEDGLVSDIVNFAKKITDDGEKMMTKSPAFLQKTDGDVNAFRMEGEAMIDKRLRSMSNSEMMEARAALRETQDRTKTGVEWYDKGRKSFEAFKVKDVEVGKKILDALDVYMGIFRRAKVAANPSSWVNATLGNPTMAAMFGVDIANRKYLKSIKDAAKYVYGKNADGSDRVSQVLFGDLWRGYMDEYSGMMKKTYGFSPGRASFQKMLQRAASNEELIKEGIDIHTSKTEMEKLVSQIMGQMRQESSYGSLSKGVDLDNVGTSMAANELYSTAFNEFKDRLQEKAKGGNPFAKAFLWSLEKPVEMYEGIDQTSKLGTALHLTENGITEAELIKMSRQMPIDFKADIASKYIENGKTFYRMTPKIATRAVNEIYMNYNAMPGAVKVLRSLPIMGSPFVAFSYAMGHKTAKSLAYNPAFFNKASFLLNEIQGKKSPLEKQGLNSKYYSWFTQGGMVKLPFFQDYPVYINLANILPYYSMNMFTPSERKYSETLPSQLAEIVDKSPFMKDPVGQLIFDYFIQPMLIKDGPPQGQFGQSLYPSDATALEKTGYAARSLAEGVVPGFASYAGLVGGLALPESINNAAPSYKYRQLANAVQGKTSIGAESSEGAASKTLRGILSGAGIQTYPMDLTFLRSKAEKGEE